MCDIKQWLGRRHHRRLRYRRRLRRSKSKVERKMKNDYFITNALSTIEFHSVDLQTGNTDVSMAMTKCDTLTACCWQNYVDYFKCIDARGEDFVPCKQFWRNYHSLCPNSWVEKWDTQREAGENPSNFSL
ncbi:hypothetical protein [Absidia glauca]|uniref:Cytochrome c oxidase subunit 6B n=1 Tax=Absidia glauca TaxID=4829 RepID=A0A168MJ70_ABSGL|nr:hypothetical protein [Absidia glauca]